MLVKIRYLFLVAITIVGGFYMFICNNSFDMTIVDRSTVLARPNPYNDSDERFTINTEGCRISAMKPLDKSVAKFVRDPEGLKYCNSTLALLENNTEKIWVKHDQIKYYNISDVKKLSCCYRGFYRPKSVDDITSHYVDDRAKYKPCVKFNDSVAVKDEFVRVICSVGKKTVYEQFFAFAPLKKFTSHNGIREIPSNRSGYNVLVLGIDAVSRLNFHRTMPKTANYFKEHGAVEMLGYNKVGDNTFPNLIPMLAGVKAKELTKICFPHQFSNFDNCPFVWEWFKQAGYYNAFGEDTASLGLFNYLKAGFSNTPTDYYLYTFIYEANKHVGNNQDLNANLCMKDKFFYKVLLDYVENLTKTLQHTRMFGFFWEITVSHDYLNYPKIMDDDYVKLLNSLGASGYLNNTILLLASDHGIRWGNLRRTKQGRLEERLPLMYVLTPPSFRENYRMAYRNLKLNSKRLTTPFDVHATLMDLIDLANLKDGAIAERSNTSYSNDRSISMFLPIGSNRTCKAADIDDHWCTCHKGVTLSNDDPKTGEAANKLVALLNVMLKSYPQCARLSLDEILYVTKVEAGKPDKGEVSWTEYMVVTKTSPGGGIFEATLKQEGKDWTLAGTASRLNLYGDQSRCVDQNQLKLYCYCD